MTNRTIQITFIENEMYFAILGLTPIRFPEENGAMTEPKPCFEIDLDRNSNRFGLNEKQKWRYKFERWEDNLNKAIRHKP